jgi:hypothetical protein
VYLASAGWVSIRRVHTLGRAPAGDQTPTRPPTRWCGLRPAPFFTLGPALGTPRPDHGCIALGGPLNRHLGSPVPAFQEPGDMGFVGPNASRLSDHRRHTGAGPTLAPKAVGVCTVGEECWDHTPWVACEFDRPCGPRLGLPCRHAGFTPIRQPLANRRGGHTQRFSTLPRFPPALFECKCPLAAYLLPGLGTSMLSVHVRMLAHGKN